jgi:hypothetical protein
VGVAGKLSCTGIGVGALILLAALTIPSAPAGAAQAGNATADPNHSLPWYATPPSPTGRPVVGHVPVSPSQTVTDAPGNVYYQAPPPTLVSSPKSDPADLISASATDDGTTLTFTAKTVALTDPTTDLNWRNNSYIGWAIDPNSSGTPQYFAYFQVNADGSYNGALKYAATNTLVSCTVTLGFNTSAGYQAMVPTACLPGVSIFQWFAYTLYDTVPLAQDPTGAFGFGKALPDYRRNGGTVFAPPVASPSVPSTADGIPAGYWLFARDGGVFSFGRARFHGSEGGVHLNQAVVGGAATPDGQGYWMVASDGGIFAFGDARFYGSTGTWHLNAPIVAMIPLPTGTGYWLVASDGGVFSFGGARFHGSTGALHLNQPMVGGASTPDGLGYWLVARDGGVFAFGDARFQGSTGGFHLNQPMVGMAGDDQGGYWLVASDGGVFSFGGAPFYGSTGAYRLVRPIEGIAANASAGGYRMVASDGGIFAFGSAPFLGSEGGWPLNQPVVGMASVG